MAETEPDRAEKVSQSMSVEEENKRDDAMLAAEYALGILPHAERITFAKRLATDPSLQEEVAFWETHYQGLLDEVDPVAPPAETFSKIESRLFQPDGKKNGILGSLAFWRRLAFAAMLMVVALSSLLYLERQTPDQSGPTYIAEIKGDTGAIRLAALYDAKSGAMQFNRLEGEPAKGRDFELWLIAESDTPISLGVLPKQTKGTIQLSPELQTKIPGSVLAVSDEPAGGSPTGQVTGPVIATGKVSSI